jgi:hypothetical protein
MSAETETTPEASVNQFINDFTCETLGRAYRFPSLVGVKSLYYDSTERVQKRGDALRRWFLEVSSDMKDEKYAVSIMTEIIVLSIIRRYLYTNTNIEVYLTPAVLDKSTSDQDGADILIADISEPNILKPLLLIDATNSPLGLNNKKPGINLPLATGVSVISFAGITVFNGEKDAPLMYEMAKKIRAAVMSGDLTYEHIVDFIDEKVADLTIRMFTDSITKCADNLEHLFVRRSCVGARFRVLSRSGTEIALEKLYQLSRLLELECVESIDVLVSRMHHRRSRVQFRGTYSDLPKRDVKMPYKRAEQRRLLREEYPDFF